MADNDYQLDVSNLLFPSVISQALENHQDGKQRTDMQNVTGFASFQDSNLNSNIDDQNDWEYMEEYKNKSKRRKRETKKENERFSSDSSSTENRKKNKKKKKKKKRKNERKKDLMYDTLKPDTIWIENTTLSLENAFRLDKRSEKENLCYDSLYRLDIANYVRKSDIRCLGLRKNQNIEWTDQRSKKRTKKEKRTNFRYYDSIAKNDLIIDVDDGNSFSNVSASGDGFIPMKSFSNVGKEQNGMMPHTEDIRMEGDEEKQSQTSEKYFSRRTEYFNKKLRDNPSDVESWLKFVELQDKAFDDGDNEFFSTTFIAEFGSSKRELAIREKKISILDKALFKNPKSVPIIIEYMRCCRGIEDSAELMKKWNEITFKYPNKGLLWQEFLLLHPSSVLNFSTRNTLAAYYKCLSTLSSISDGSFKSHNPEKNCLENMMKIFLQCCFFMLQSDQQEKAIASLQALIEFNFFAPDNITSMPASGQKQFFEAFWDSEAPRFGEQKAIGWKNWMSNQHGKDDSISSSFETDSIHRLHPDLDDTFEGNELIKKDLCKSKQWLYLERKRIENFWKPWKQNEEDDNCDDPDRTVLVDDIIPLLFKIDKETSEANLLQLVVMLLILLGVPVKTEILSHYILEKLLSLDIISKQVKIFEKSDSVEIIHMDNADINLQTQESPLHISDSKLSLAQRIFTQTLNLGSKYSQNFTNTVSRCWLFFECVFFKQHFHSKQNKERMRKNFKKFAKSLLKLPANRNCIDLWEMLALHENDVGDQVEAIRIYDMLISMCNEKKEQGALINPFSYLYRRYATFLLHANKQGCKLENKVINLLSLLSQDIPKTTSVIPNEKMNPLRLRKVKASFEEIYSMLVDRISQETTFENDAAKSPPVPDENQFDWLLSYVVFEYVSSNITAANYVLIQLETNLELSRSQTLNVAKLRIVLHQNLLDLHQITLSEYHKMLCTTLNFFPEDPIINQYLIDVESGCFTSLKFRRFFQTAMKNAKSINPFLFAIKFELKRWRSLQDAYRRETNVFNQLELIENTEMVTNLPSSGIANRLRGLFQRSVTNRYGHLCVTLWRSYIRFEVDCGNLKRAKNIFYQALQNVPWSKAIYMDAVEFFPDDFEEILDIMQEKEIRVRLPVEELDILLED